MNERKLSKVALISVECKTKVPGFHDLGAVCGHMKVNLVGKGVRSLFCQHGEQICMHY